MGEIEGVIEKAKAAKDSGKTLILLRKKQNLYKLAGEKLEDEKILETINERTGSGSGGLFKKIRPLVIHNNNYNHINTFHPRNINIIFQWYEHS